MEEKYLPVGTVCLLKGGSKRVMIIGFGIRPNENPDIMYDYLGCLFPEGVVSLEQNMVFNHDQIDNIVAKGFADEETEKFNAALKEAIAGMNVKQAPSNAPTAPAAPEAAPATPKAAPAAPAAPEPTTPEAVQAVQPAPIAEQVAPQPQANATGAEGASIPTLQFEDV